jgi:hypothetical protein
MSRLVPLETHSRLIARRWEETASLPFGAPMEVARRTVDACTRKPGANAPGLRLDDDVRLNIEVGDVEGVVGDEFAPSFNAFAHQSREDLFAFDGVVHAYLE